MSEQSEQKNQGEQKSAQQKLNDLLGFDTTKAVSGAGVLNEAMKEIQAERDAANKLKAHELIKKAIACAGKMEEAKSQFNSAMGKSEKELNKIIGSIEALGDSKK